MQGYLIIYEASSLQVNRNGTNLFRFKILDFSIFFHLFDFGSKLVKP